jgi:ADP-ribose pyrophosphatase YjhB (NUDIX family)
VITLNNLLVDCKCLILDERNRILLVREPEHWETPGGRLHEVETPIECLTREISEELGADVEILDKLPIFIRKKTKQRRRRIDI